MRKSRLICVGIILLTVTTACKKHNSQSGSNTIVYVAGYVPGVNGLQPVLWKNGVSNSLPAMLSGVANAITIADTNIYIGGTCYTDTGLPVITYWKNGVLNVIYQRSQSSPADNFRSRLTLSKSRLTIIIRLPSIKNPVAPQFHQLWSC